MWLLSLNVPCVIGKISVCCADNWLSYFTTLWVFIILTDFWPATVKFQKSNVEISISPFSSISVCFMYFEAELLCTYLGFLGLLDELIICHYRISLFCCWQYFFFLTLLFMILKAFSFLIFSIYIVHLSSSSYSLIFKVSFS